MDTLEAIERLADLARRDVPPDLEVRDMVLVRIEYERRARRLRRVRWSARLRCWFWKKFRSLTWPM